MAAQRQKASKARRTLVQLLDVGRRLAENHRRVKRGERGVGAAATGAAAGLRGGAALAIVAEEGGEKRGVGASNRGKPCLGAARCLLLLRCAEAAAAAAAAAGA